MKAPALRRRLGETIDPTHRRLLSQLIDAIERGWPWWSRRVNIGQASSFLPKEDQQPGRGRGGG